MDNLIKYKKAVQIYMLCLTDLMDNDNFIITNGFGNYYRIRPSKEEWEFILERSRYDNELECEVIEEEKVSPLYVLNILAGGIGGLEFGMTLDLSTDNYAYFKTKNNPSAQTVRYPSYQYLCDAIIKLRIAEFTKERTNNKILSFDFAKFKEVKQALPKVTKEEECRVGAYSIAETELIKHTQELLLVNKDKTKATTKQRFNYVYSQNDDCDNDGLELLDTETEIDLEEFSQRIIYHYKYQETNKEQRPDKKINR